MNAGPSWRPFLADVSPPAEDDVAALEAWLRVALPEDYKAVVRRHAGRTPDPGRVPVGRGSAPFGVLLAPRTRPNDPYASYGVPAQAAVLERWSQGRPGISRLVPIADSTGHELICLNFRSDGLPSAVLVDLDYPATDDRALARVADSFTDLLGRLRP